MLFPTTIIIWSRTGNTPITKRGGGFCDELVHVTLDCASPDEALVVTAELKARTPHAYACHFHMPDFPNQNTRSQFCHYG